jgi:hypothetical protein
MSLNYANARALLKLTTSKHDVVEVVQQAGVMMGKERMLVIQDLLFYLSSDASFFGTY